MASALTVHDFFALGLGLDLAGGYLVARGLLTSDTDMATAGTYAGFGAQATVARARDRIDATFGLVFLGLGFVLQIVGYTAQEAGVQAGRTGYAPAGTFVLLTAAALLVGLLLHWLVAPARVRALALRVSMLDGHALPRELPDGKTLLELGVELGDDAYENEPYGAYASRVWGIDSVSEPDEAPDKPERRQRQAGRASRR